MKVKKSGRHGGRPDVGIIASRTDRGRGLDAAVRSIAQARLVRSGSYKKGSVWIVYLPFEAKVDWYRDIPNWRASVVDQLLRACVDCAPLIDQGLAATQT